MGGELNARKCLCRLCAARDVRLVSAVFASTQSRQSRVRVSCPIRSIAPLFNRCAMFRKVLRHSILFTRAPGHVKWELDLASNPWVR